MEQFGANIAKTESHIFIIIEEKDQIELAILIIYNEEEQWEYQIALTCAAIRGNLELVKELLNRKAPWDIHTCVEAAKRGHLEVVKFLKQSGAPVSELNLLFNNVAIILII